MRIDWRTLTAAVALLGITSLPVLAEQNAAERYGSFEAQQEGFAGTISGDFTAEELIGKEVHGPDGTTIAYVGDLAISGDNTVRNVILDVGGFMGVGSKPVAISIDQLEQAPDDEDALQISMTEEELEALPSYERGEDGWTIM